MLLLLITVLPYVEPLFVLAVTAWRVFMRSHSPLLRFLPAVDNALLRSYVLHGRSNFFACAKLHNASEF